MTEAQWDRIRDMLCKADGLAKQEKQIAFTNIIQDIADVLGFELAAQEPLTVMSKDEYVENYR
jgi:hypothetical protein